GRRRPGGRRRGPRRLAARGVGGGPGAVTGGAVRRPVPPARLGAAGRLEVGRADGRQPVPVGLPAVAAAAGAAARGPLGAGLRRRGLPPRAPPLLDAGGAAAVASAVVGRYLPAGRLPPAEGRASGEGRRPPRAPVADGPLA